jgi:ribosomal protein S18 acetylase RimI-like enzyme
MLSGERVTRDKEISYLAETITSILRGTRIHLVVIVDGIFAANSGIDVYKRRKRHVGELNISVASEFRDDGVGFELLKALIAEAKKRRLKLITMTCMEVNERALHLYEKAGFKRAGVIPKSLLFRKKFFGEVILYRPL